MIVILHPKHHDPNLSSSASNPAELRGPDAQNSGGRGSHGEAMGMSGYAS